MCWGADGPEGLFPRPWLASVAGTYVAGVIDGRGCAVDTTVVVLVEPDVHRRGARRPKMRVAAAPEMEAPAYPLPAEPGR